MSRTSMEFLAALALATVLPAGARAQYSVQAIHLEPGWNPVYLEVDPVDASSRNLLERFAGRIESLWSYDNRDAGERAFEPIEFSEDIEVPPVRVKNRWRVYHPDHPEVSNLHRLRGSRGYLIQVRNDSEPFAVEVTGAPVPSDPWWIPNDYSLKGFPVDPLAPAEGRPTFLEYFCGSPVHLADGSEIYTMRASGEMQGPLDKATTRIEPGRAYWVYTDGASRYRGPVEVDGATREGIDFGTSLVETPLDLRNTTAVEQEVTLRLRSTLHETPPGRPVSAGDIRLQYLDVNATSSGWVDLDEQGVPVTVTASSTRRIRLQVRRQGLPVALVGTQHNGSGEVPVEALGSSYQGQLEIVTAPGVRERLALQTQVEGHAGLWVGTVRLRFVRRVTRDPPNGDQPATTFEGGRSLDDVLRGSFPDTAEGSDDSPELTFPLILHVGLQDPQQPEGDHELWLLRQVALLWKPGNANCSEASPQDCGRQVLLTRQGLAAGLIEEIGLVGGTLKDGRRFSYVKTAPTFHKDVKLSGPAQFLGNREWTTDIVIPAQDPLNPYIHRYHPDHGHKQVMRQTGVPARGGLDVKRQLELSFSDTDPYPRTVIDPETGEPKVENRPEFGDTILGGSYREVIEHLTYHPVVVQGRFEVRKVVPGIAVLNDGREL